MTALHRLDCSGLGGMRPGCRERMGVIMSARTWIRMTQLLAIALVASACTFPTVTPEMITAPPRMPSTVVVGDINSEDKLWEYLVPHFKRGLVERLNEKKLFLAVKETAAEVGDREAVVVTGQITEVDKGSAALRFIVGFGAGRAKVSGSFEIKDLGGKTLARFSGGESYAGGVGIGGAGFIDMEDLMRRFGATVGDTVARWVKGDKIE